MNFRTDTVFENSVFPQKDAQPQDEGLRKTGDWGATPPTSKCTKGYRCALLAGLRKIVYTILVPN